MGSAWWDDHEDETEGAYGTPAWVVVLFLGLLIGLPLLILWLAP